jgi:hypothetical protein
MSNKGPNLGNNIPGVRRENEGIVVASSDPHELALQFARAAVERSGSGSLRDEYDTDALEELVEMTSKGAEVLDLLRNFGASILHLK